MDAFNGASPESDNFRDGSSWIGAISVILNSNQNGISIQSIRKKCSRVFKKITILDTVPPDCDMIGAEEIRALSHKCVVDYPFKVETHLNSHARRQVESEVTLLVKYNLALDSKQLISNYLGVSSNISSQHPPDHNSSSTVEFILSLVYLGGQYLPDWHFDWLNSSLSNSQLLPEIGGQHGPEYPLFFTKSAF